MIDITPLLYALGLLILALVSTFMIPYIKEKTSNEELAKIQKWVAIAVSAAEQIYDEAGLGRIKKEYVVKFLNKKGYNLDTDSIDKLIESAVYALKGGAT